MTTPRCHEITRLRQQLDSAERELNHRAEIIREQADELARLRMGLQSASSERAFPGTKSFAAWIRDERFRSHGA